MPQHMRCLVTVGIITQREFLDVHSGEVERYALYKKALHLRSNVFLHNYRTISILLVLFQQPVDLFQWYADYLAQFRQLLLRILERRRKDRHGQTRTVLDQRDHVAVIDYPPGRLLHDEAGTVVFGHGHVLIAGKDLQEPDTEDKDGEEQHGHATYE